jgi:glycolate oxidase iron-sulfur subunit
MKDYGRLLGTEDARRFSARVRDFSEWLAVQPPLDVAPTGQVVVVQDPCHLRHVQHAEGPVRQVLGDAYTCVDTPDDGLCCGAGGAYAVFQAELAGEIRDRKVAAIRAASRARSDDEPLVASANPGCAMHLAATGLDVRHPAELLAAALARRPSGSIGA